MKNITPKEREIRDLHHNLLTPDIRKNMVEEICKGFHEDGIERLKIVGHFEKYTSLYHFRIAEPNEGPFIFITELFGNRNTNSNLLDYTRLQYHGGYEGLDKMILQGVSPIGAGAFLKASFQVSTNLTEENKLGFDNALRYINGVLRHMTPENKEFDLTSETFSSTYIV